MLNNLYWRLFIIRLSLRWIKQLNLGDKVAYDGQLWTLNQGVHDPYWSLVREGEYMEVHRDLFRKVRGPSSAWRSFKSGYRFYMGCWYSIWTREGLKPWMLACSIWVGKPPQMRERS